MIRESALSAALALLETNVTELMGDKELNVRFTVLAQNYIYASIRRASKDE